MTVQQSGQPRRLTADAYLAAAADALGDIEVTSEATFDADTTAKRALYASSGIASTVHHRAFILDEPLPLTITFDDLQRP